MGAITCVTGVSTVLGDTETIARKTGGLHSITLFAMSILNLVETAVPLPVGLVNLTETLSKFDDFTSFPSLLRRWKTWTSPDEKGEWIYSKPWVTIGETTSFTVFTAAKFVRFLNSVKIIDLGTEVAKRVGRIGFLSLVIMSVCSLWDNFKGKAREDFHRDFSKIKGRITGWNANKALAQNILQWKQLVARKIEALEAKLHKDNSMAEVTPEQIDQNAKTCKKIRKWEHLKLCTNIDEVRAYCDKKVDKWQAVGNDKIKDRIISVAFSVSLLALMVFLLWMPAAPVITAGLDVAVSGLDMWSTHRSNCMAKPAEPALPASVGAPEPKKKQ